MMDTLILLADILLAFLCAYNAGKLKATLDIDRIDGIPFNWTCASLAMGNALCSLYLIIAVYGMGLKHV